MLIEVHTSTSSPILPQATMRATILVVDDDAEVQEIVADFLSDFGHDVLRASGGLEALEVVRQNPDLDLVITDVRMPDISGIDLAGIITNQQPALPIILISGYFLSQHVGWRVLHKPFRLQELEQAVQEELAR